jgi:hypothetical protein
MSLFLVRASACVLVAVTAMACGKKNAPPPTGAASGSPSEAVAAAGLGLSFLNAFEGEIGILAKDAEKPGKPATPLSLLIKEGKLRVEFPPEMAASTGMTSKGYAVLNGAEKKLYAVLEDKKQVILIDLDKAGEQLKGLSAASPHARDNHEATDHTTSAPPKVTKTGKNDKVAGYTCEIWDVASEADKASICVANEGASWLHLPLTGIPTEHAWALELLDGKHFPLRAIGYDKVGAEKGRVEVTKIEKRVLAPALFEIPEGYKVVDLQQMFMALGAMGKFPPGAGLPPGMIPPRVVLPKGAPPPSR